MPDDPAGVFVGLTTVDSIAYVDAPPAANSKVVAAGHEIAAGGPCANAAIAFAALGGHATLATSLGSHPLAGLARRELEALGVEVWDAAPAQVTPPPLAAVSVTRASGERSVVLAPGPDVSFAPTAPHLAELVRRLEAADVVLADGHHPDLLRAVLERTGAGTDTVLDAGSWKPVLRDVIGRIDLVACSADFTPPSVPTGEADQVAAWLLHAGAGAVAVTGGPAPVRWWTPAEHGEVPARDITARDTTGAGDAFHGALCFARAAHPDSSLSDQIALANEVAAIRCSHLGARAWLGSPALAELRSRIHQAY